MKERVIDNDGKNAAAAGIPVLRRSAVKEFGMKVTFAVAAAIFIAAVIVICV